MSSYGPLDGALEARNIFPTNRHLLTWRVAAESLARWRQGVDRQPRTQRHWHAHRSPNVCYSNSTAKKMRVAFTFAQTSSSTPPCDHAADLPQARKDFDAWIPPPRSTCSQRSRERTRDPHKPGAPEGPPPQVVQGVGMRPIRETAESEPHEQQ